MTESNEPAVNLQNKRRSFDNCYVSLQDSTVSTNIVCFYLIVVNAYSVISETHRHIVLSEVWGETVTAKALVFLLCISGIIVRSSIWLGLPNLVSGISVANSSDVWPEVFCVGSAVRTAP